MDFTTTVIPATVRSLVWQGETLVDWVGGAQQLHLDGSITPRRVNYAYCFDAVVASPSGRFAVIYTRYGTKGLVLDRGNVIRELNRSFYFANTYEYPVAFLQLPDGREAIAHCPTHYNRLMLEDAETGETIIPPQSDSLDFFHSRLMASHSGEWLISAGWHWHPFSTIRIFNILQCLRDHRLFNGKQEFVPGEEVSIASFVDDRTLVVNCEPDGSGILDDEELAAQPLSLTPRSIGLFDLPDRKFAHVVALEEDAGLMMPLNRQHVIGFFQHPKLIDITTGRVLRRWPELSTGRQMCSITSGKDGTPPLALDPMNRRFAVADEKQVHVVAVRP